MGFIHITIDEQPYPCHKQKNTTFFKKGPPAGLIVSNAMQRHYSGFQLSISVTNYV